MNTPQTVAMRPHTLDLFGEVPVTWEEVYEWCDNNPRISSTPWRRDWYIKNYNVIFKIQREKRAGIIAN